MKKYALIMIGLLGWGLLTAEAQNTKRRISDPTYSPHNYKHPNKAAAAQVNNDQAISASTSGELENVINPVAAKRNYKVQGRTRGQNDALLVLPGKPVENNLNPLQSPRNYKRQNQTTPKVQPKPALEPSEPMVNTDGDNLY